MERSQRLCVTLTYRLISHCCPLVKARGISDVDDVLNLPEVKNYKVKYTTSRQFGSFGSFRVRSCALMFTDTAVSP